VAVQQALALLLGKAQAGVSQRFALADVELLEQVPTAVVAKIEHRVAQVPAVGGLVERRFGVPGQPSAEPAIAGLLEPALTDPIEAYIPAQAEADLIPALVLGEPAGGVDAERAHQLRSVVVDAERLEELGALGLAAAHDDLRQRFAVDKMVECV